MQYRMLIDGVDYSDTTLIDTVSISYGRTDISQQPAPGTFNATISVLPGETIVPIGLDGTVEFQTYYEAGAYWIHLFTGYITDVNANLGMWSNGAGVIEYQISALGHLSRFNRAIVGTTGFIKKYDCDRIDDINTDAGVGLSVTTSRAIGTYEIAAVSNGEYDALQLMQDTANSSMSVLIDTPEPDDVGYTPVTYTTYLDRAFLPSASFTVDQVIAGGLGVSKSMTKIVNRAFVTYGSSSSSSSTVYTDPATNFSELSASRNTYLHNLSDANSVAQTLLAGRKQELFELSALTFNTSALSNTDVYNLATLRNGHHITITGLPFDDVTNFDGFVEGWTWNINKNGSTYTMNVSNYGQTYPYTLWNTPSISTYLWNNIYTASTTWEDVI